MHGPVQGSPLQIRLSAIKTKLVRPSLVHRKRASDHIRLRPFLLVVEETTKAVPSFYYN